MKCQLLLAIALYLGTAFSGLANSLPEQEQRSRLQLLRTNDVKNLQATLIERTYVVTYGILSDDNECSRFFGRGSRKVLDELVIRLRIQTIPDTSIACRMSGHFSNVLEPQENVAYRLFDRAELNSLGAFYRSKMFASEPFVPNMGSFRPNTKEARVLILLHELAHLIKGDDGMWLIPDDGSSVQLSRANTLAVESRCEQQIRAL